MNTRLQNGDKNLKLCRLFDFFTAFF